MGVGFLLAGLLLLMFPPPGPSREEIIDRARGYGMVFREEVVPFPLDTERAGPALEPQPASRPEPSVDTGEVLVTIPPGSTLEEIAALLEEKGIVDKALFEAEVRRAGVTGRLRAGSHYLPKGDVAGVLERLTN
ncbi:MAG: hypothetical protein IMW96_02310 [Thermoanaerobacteraceae bacterium]|nr:hypothetical protein [Thermoanaerobacteraceae bacterium]